MVDVCNNVVLHLLPRPAALAGSAVGGRDRDRAGDQEERELLLECAWRTRVSSTGPPRGVNQRISSPRRATCSIISVLTQWGATLVIQLRERKTASLGLASAYAPENRGSTTWHTAVSFHLLPARCAAGYTPQGEGVRERGSTTRAGAGLTVITVVREQESESANIGPACYRTNFELFSRPLWPSLNVTVVCGSVLYGSHSSHINTHSQGFSPDQTSPSHIFYN